MQRSKMRLLNTETLKLQEFFDEDISDYAILSHRWQNNEVSYQDLQADKNKDGAGYRKILGCCAKALQDGYEWIWIDTCCIDKTSSAELSEAINAMFRWYEAAALCYAYLCDVEEVVLLDSCFTALRPKRVGLLTRHASPIVYIYAVRSPSAPVSLVRLHSRSFGGDRNV